MKYFFLLIIMSSFGFMFYKGLKIDPSVVPSYVLVLLFLAMSVCTLLLFIWSVSHSPSARYSSYR